MVNITSNLLQYTVVDYLYKKTINITSNLLQYTVVDY